jgi:hypothetical protein
MQTNRAIKTSNADVYNSLKQVLRKAFIIKLLRFILAVCLKT